MRRNLEKKRKSSDQALIDAASKLLEDTRAEQEPAAPASDSAGVEELEALRQEVQSLRQLQEVLSCTRAEPADWSELGFGVLRGALNVSGMKRGLLSLRVPGDSGRFRVQHRHGFEAEDQPQVDVLLRLMGGTLQRRRVYAIRGDLLRFADGEEGPCLGAVVTLPLVADGELLGAIVLDDPGRREEVTDAESSRLEDYAQQTARVLAHRVRKVPAKRAS